MIPITEESKKQTYLIYYTDKYGESNGYTVYGSKRLFDNIKWLNSQEISATHIEIYKCGKNFENDKDDIIEIYKQYWK